MTGPKKGPSLEGNQHSLGEVREAETRGYTLGVEPNKSFSLSKNGAKTFLYSNADIKHLGETWKSSSKKGL